jgi:hypothetical protein
MKSIASIFAIVALLVFTGTALAWQPDISQKCVDGTSITTVTLHADTDKSEYSLDGENGPWTAYENGDKIEVKGSATLWQRQKNEKDEDSEKKSESKWQYLKTEIVGLDCPKPTTPPVTEPPVTQPPVTQPPVTQPPVTQPPVTQPPVTEPPTVPPSASPVPSAVPSTVPSVEPSVVPSVEPSVPPTPVVVTPEPELPQTDTASGSGWGSGFPLLLVAIALFTTMLLLRAPRR